MKFGISATFTGEPLERIIAFWASQLGTPLEVEFAPYNQLSQTLLDPESVFGRNHSGVNVLLLRADDLQVDDPEGHAQELIAQIRSTQLQRLVPLIVCICPSSPTFAGEISRIITLFREGLTTMPGVALMEPGAIQSLYLTDGCYSEHGDRVAKLPYREPYYAALGTALVRRALALLRTSHKVIVLDCDNTLWRGLCGEDGPAGVTVEPGRRVMHKFLKQRRAEGMLLAIASKNNPDDVIETFRQNPEIPLQLGDFAAWRINWAPKVENLQSLALELNVRLDSFIFIDDDPRECAEVQELLPEVLTLPLPHDAGNIPHFLNHIWAFDQGVLTEADRLRAMSYESVREFAEAMAAASSYEAFIANLNLKVTILVLEPGGLSRAAQLTQRTNQFNATTHRRNEAQLQALVRAGAVCWMIDVADRYGEYGHTGLVIFQQKPDELEVDTLLLSCRVLGRGVEHRTLVRLAEEAVHRGAHYVAVSLSATARNRPVQEFLRQVAKDCGVAWREGTPNQEQFRFPVEKLLMLSWKPPSGGPRTLPKVTHASKPTPLPYLRIAQTLATVDQILDAMRAGIRFDHAQLGTMTATEQRLALIWSEILEVRSVAPRDNFFDLGGHSLLVVLLQMRVREEFGVELDSDELYSSTLTLVSLAAQVERKRIGELSPDDYRALVAEIESLSDDEVQDLLAREERTY